MNSFSFIIPSTSTCGEKSVKLLISVILYSIVLSLILVLALWFNCIVKSDVSAAVVFNTLSISIKPILIVFAENLKLLFSLFLNKRSIS
ncbi:hypothetical protein [Spiroplasma endosymbiont of Apeira syringaria]|uniref:hypothetical protein n=1 Tax=Spiroplasma endosymbiont of Apeira syringaria TaxID=3066307 RepID=UPI0030D0267A